MNKITYITILLSLLMSQSIFSQDGEYITTRDLESWNSINLRYKIHKDWFIGLEEQVRFKTNASKFDAFFTELSTGYKFNSSIWAGTGLRYVIQNDTEGKVQGFENHMRFHIDLGYNYTWKRINLESRLRFQTKNELGVTREQGDYPNNHLRLKIGLKYNIKKWKLDPEISTEIFRHYENGEKNEFDALRFTAGTKYKIKGFGKIGVFYRMERELNVSYPKTTNIIGVKYTYTLKNKKKK